MRLLTILVAEPVRCPNAAVAIRPVDRVDKPVALGFFRKLAFVCGIAQQPRRHARPKGEDDKGQKVAHGHGPPPPLVHRGPKGWGTLPPVLKQRLAIILLLQFLSRLCCREVVEDDEEKDGSRDVNKRIRLVRPPHQRGVCEEPGLDRGLDEDSEALFDMNDLERMLPGRVDCGLQQRDCGEGSPKLVDLQIVSMAQEKQHDGNIPNR